MLKDEFIKKIPLLEKVFVISSNFTKGPFVYCDKESFDDTAIICLDEDTAKNSCRELERNNNKVKILEVSNKELLSALSGMHLYGINAVDFIGEDFEYKYQLTEIISFKNREDMENKPVENPILQLVMLYFIQELKKGSEHMDIESLKRHQEELIVNLQKAKLILPFQETDLEGEKKLRLALLVNNEKVYLPMFTDLMEFNRFNRANEKIKLMMFDFKDVLKMEVLENIEALIINPSGVRVNIEKELIKALKSN